MFKIISGGVCIEYTNKRSEVIDALKLARKDVQVFFVWPTGHAKRVDIKGICR